MSKFKYLIRLYTIIFIPMNACSHYESLDGILLSISHLILCLFSACLPDKSDKICNRAYVPKLIRPPMQ